MKIMVVDDAVIIRHTIKKMFNEIESCEVVCEAGNGYDAIEKFKQYKPDMVTMDITMEGKNGVKNGIEALEQIIKIEPKTIVVMLTSHGEEKLIMDAISKGAKGYILKPVKKEKLEKIAKQFQN